MRSERNLRVLLEEDSVLVWRSRTMSITGDDKGVELRLREMLKFADKPKLGEINKRK